MTTKKKDTETVADLESAKLAEGVEELRKRKRAESEEKTKGGK